MRIKLLIAFFTIVWLILLSRIYHLSIKSNTYYKEIAQRNVIKIEPLAPLRGTIVDRNLEPLAVNKLGFTIEITPHLGSKSKIKILEEEIEFISSLFKKFDKEKLKKRYLKRDSPYSHDFVKVINFVSYEEMVPNFSKLSMRKNIKVMPASKRYYPYKYLASHILGYVAKANLKEIKRDKVAKLTGFIGRSGIERYYNKELEGKAGYRRVKVTAFNKEIEELERVKPTNQDIKLTIDLELQKYITELFQKKSGAVIVMNANTGAILAAGSYPEYDLNSFVNGISYDEWNKLANDFAHPFTNKLVNGLYPPGSVVKMGVALAFLDSKLLNERMQFFCSGEFELGGRKFRCWKKEGHGRVDMKKAIRESCDDYFYKGSLRVGIDKISPMLEKLGFSKKTGVDLPGEFIGSVPGRMWKMHKYQRPWYQGETLITSIGQGYFLVTPMQVAKYTALLATGKSPTPHLVEEIGGKKIEHKVQEDVLSEYEKSKLPIIQKAMQEVCNHPKGTASHYLNAKVKIAGKTGTAQVVGIPQEEKERMKESELTYYKRSHAWLTTYGPYNDPKYVVTVMVEHGGHGGHAAGGMVSRIYDKLLKMGYL
jgi:penicillin-binding protein 2